MQRLMGRALPEDDKPAKRATADLTVRLYSALVMIAVALFLTLTSVESFAILVSLFIAAMAWEWGRLVRSRGLDLAFALQLASTVIASWITAQGRPDFAVPVLFAGSAAVFIAVAAASKGARAFWSAAGVFYAGLPAVALIWLRTDGFHGALVILYLFAIVWATDSAAYLFGRLVGGPKLWPQISPKKTWAGFIGGVGAAGVVGVVFGYASGLADLRLGLLAFVLGVVAQFGDLGESAIKRVFGIKDSSGLIPGHGGVLDRIDGLIAAAVAGACLAWLIDPVNPGKALLVWP